MGGLETLVLNVAKELQNHGFEVSVICKKEGNGFGDEEIHDNILFHRIGTSEIGEPFLRYSYYFALVNKFRKIGLDALHCFNDPLNCFIKSKIKILHMGNNIFESFSHNCFRKIYNCFGTKLYRKSLNNVDSIVCCSDFVKGRLVENLGKGIERKVKVIYNGVDTALFKPIAKRKISAFRDGMGFNEDDLIHLYVGQINEMKGLHVLIEAMKRIQNPKIHLLVAGSPKLWVLSTKSATSTYEERIRHESKRLNVKFLGNRSKEELVYLYNMADAIVFPSIYEEAFGYTIAEAMACSKPIIATKVGAVPELVKNNETGILVPPRDPKSLAQAILKLSTDGTLRRSCGKAARAKAKKMFSLKQMARKLITVYNEFL